MKRIGFPRGLWALGLSLHLAALGIPCGCGKQTPLMPTELGEDGDEGERLRDDDQEFGFDLQNPHPPDNDGLLAVDDPLEDDGLETDEHWQRADDPGGDRRDYGLRESASAPGKGPGEAHGANAVTPVVGSDADRTAVVAASNEFALDLYRQKPIPGNRALSPISVLAGLCATYAGESGQPGQEMTGSLPLSLYPERLHPEMRQLIAELVSPSRDGYYFRVASALWAPRGPRFSKDDVDSVGIHARAGGGELEAAPAPEAYRAAIETWLVKQIQKPASSAGLGIRDSLTGLVLTSTACFKGHWTHPFDRGRNPEMPFTTRESPAGYDTFPVQMMAAQARFRYLEEDDFQAVELPYVESNMSMVVFLPKKMDGLASFEKRLSAAALRKWRSRLSLETVSVLLPKFEVSAHSELARDLQSLGLAEVFRGASDSSALACSARDSLSEGKRKCVTLSAVIHVATVAAEEESREADSRGGAADPERAPVIFRADHPFFFMIHDIRSGLILFLGRVVDPRPAPRGQRESGDA